MIAATPQLSVIVVGDNAESLGPLLESLDAQTAKDLMEVVVVAPATAHDAIAAAMPIGLAASRFIDQTPLRALAPAKAKGVKAARAEAVVFTETHAFPGPDWAEALIEAHSRERCAAIGPVLVNANPRPLSWANLLLDYGPFLAGSDGDARAVPDLPGHNSSYRREVLVGYGDDLEAMLEVETAVHQDLRRRGQRLVLEPRARIAHVNVTSGRAWLPERWLAGRIYAAARSRRWPLSRRMLYALGSWAIPAVRMPRALRHARRAGQGASLERAAPFIALGLIVQSIGEGYGYWRGAGSMAKVVEVELHRFDYLAADDPARRLRAASRPGAAAGGGAGG